MTMRNGTIVDATFIAALSSTKNKKGERDLKMPQTKKGNQWWFCRIDSGYPGGEPAAWQA
jgi:IS5 family transposase